jgi:hypothetical protein
MPIIDCRGMIYLQNYRIEKLAFIQEIAWNFPDWTPVITFHQT